MISTFSRHIATVTSLSLLALSPLQLTAQPSPARTKTRHCSNPGGGKRRRPEGATLFRPRGLRERLPRLDCEARYPDDQGREGQRGLGPRDLQGLHRRRQGRARHGEPEPVAPCPAQHAQRPVQGDRPHLPGARLRPVEHDHHRGQDRADRHRSADLHRDRQGRARPLLPAPAAEAGGGRHLHPQPRRPLRRRARRRRRGGREGAARSRSSPRQVSWRTRSART